MDNIAPAPARGRQHSLSGKAVVSTNVFTVWCGRGRNFEFRNYLSVLSVMQYTQADSFVMYYDGVLPQVDVYRYHTWLPEIDEIYPFFHTQNSRGACGKSGSAANRDFIDSVIRGDGRLYVNENVVLTGPLSPAKYDVLATQLGGAAAKRLLAGAFPDTSTIALLSNASTTTSHCQHVNNVSSSLEQRSTCIELNRTVSPKDIWAVDSDVGRLLRTIAYGKPELAVPAANCDTLVPNIAHMVWIGGNKPMKFDFLLAVLSLLYVAKVDTLYIHGTAPHGFYWNIIKDNPKIKIISRKFIGQVHGTIDKISSSVAISDIQRSYILWKYGGIYMDVDAVFVRPLPVEFRCYDALATVDVTQAITTHYPDVIQNGVLVAKPGAQFFRLHLQLLKKYYLNEYYWTCLRSTYKVKERHPTTLQFEPHLQVLCYGRGELKCRPTWWERYQEQSANYLREHRLNWTGEFNILHVAFPCPQAFEDHKKLLSTQDMFGDIARHIAQRAGLLELFHKLPLPGPSNVTRF